MSNKNKIIIALAAVIVVVLAITGIVFATNAKNKDIHPVAPGPIASQPATATDNGNATATATAVPTDKAAMTKAEEKVTAFNEAKAIPNFTKEDVQEVLKTSVSYANITLGTPYYLSGQWVKDGLPNNLDPVVGRYFTPEIRTKLKAINMDPYKNINLSKEVFPFVFFLYPANGVTGHPACFATTAEEMNKQKLSCPLNNMTFSNMQYDPTNFNDTAGIRVTFSATSDIPVLSNGKDYYTEVVDNFILNFIPNEHYDAQTNPNKFVINSYNVTTNMGAIQPVKE